MASAVLVGMLAVTALVVSVTGEEHGSMPTTHTPTATASPPLTGSATPSPSPTNTVGHTFDGECTVTDESEEIPVSTPDDVAWTHWRGAAVPASKSAGPRQVDEPTGLTGCYAHTPLGALMAAANIDFRMVLAAPDTTIVDEQMAEGPHKARYRAHITSLQPPEQVAQFVGFSYVSYQDDTATIRFAVGDPGLGYASYESTVTWQDGTWKAVAGADDTEPSSMRRLTDHNGFVPLQGVS